MEIHFWSKINEHMNVLKHHFDKLNTIKVEKNSGETEQHLQDQIKTLEQKMKIYFEKIIQEIGALQSIKQSEVDGEEATKEQKSELFQLKKVYKSNSERMAEMIEELKENQYLLSVLAEKN